MHRNQSTRRHFFYYPKNISAVALGSPIVHLFKLFLELEVMINSCCDSDSSCFFLSLSDLLTRENSQCTRDYDFFGKGDRKSMLWLFEKRLGLSDKRILDYCRATVATI